MPCPTIQRLTLTITLIVFIVMYFAVFGAGIGYMMQLVPRVRRRGARKTQRRARAQNRRPARPLSAVPNRSTQTLAETPDQEEVNSMGIDLPLIWAVIIVFGIMMYVIMDGFDLGIGILFPFIHDGTIAIR